MARARPRRTTLDERDLRRLTIRIPVEIHEVLLVLGRSRGESMNSLAVDALHEFLLRDWEPVEDWMLRSGHRYRAAMDQLASTQEPSATVYGTSSILGAEAPHPVSSLCRRQQGRKRNP